MVLRTTNIIATNSHGDKFNSDLLTNTLPGITAVK